MYTLMCYVHTSPLNLKHSDTEQKAQLYSMHFTSTLTERFPYFFFSCKANITRKDGARPALPKLVLNFLIVMYVPNFFIVMYVP
jgi:hypothetical protein